jgi:3-polyprenyl-4-hydroxybenzoate decarboxylase
VVVVGPDVNPYDLNEVEWAILTRVQPKSDTIINQSGQAFLMDPSANKDSSHGIALQSEQIGIDATIKVFERFDSYPEYSNSDPEDVAAIAKKLKGLNYYTQGRNQIFQKL